MLGEGFNFRAVTNFYEEIFTVIRKDNCFKISGVFMHYKLQGFCMQELIEAL